MFYDVTVLWLWLAAAALVGAAIGWLTEGPEPQAPWFHGRVKTAVIVFVLAILAVVIRFFSGRAAFWVETAVLFIGAYGVGALVGGALRRMRLIGQAARR